MSKNIVITIMMAYVLIEAVSAAEPGPANDIPELAILSNWAGDWDARTEKPTPRVGASHGEWIVGGRYLQQTRKVEADANNLAISGTYIMTYDAKQQVFRQWQFVSNGNTSEATGEWDADTRTMTWTSRDADTGITTVNSDQFSDTDEQHWTITVTDREGNPVFAMSGNNSRRKE